MFERAFGRCVMLNNPERSWQRGLKQVAPAQGQATFFPQVWEKWRGSLGSALCFFFSFFIFPLTDHSFPLCFYPPTLAFCLDFVVIPETCLVQGTIRSTYFSPSSLRSFIKALLFLAVDLSSGDPCFAESSSLFTSMMLPLYPPPYI